MGPLKKQLEDCIEQYHIEIIVLEKQVENFNTVLFKLKSQSWELLIDDEYGYLNQNKQPICFFMVLRELELYFSEDDFLSWSKQNSSNASSAKLLDYYRELNTVSNEIMKALNGFTVEVVYLDLQLLSGDFSQLLME